MHHCVPATEKHITFTIMREPKESDTPLSNINTPENVNQADRIEGNPEKMLDLIDLIFGFTESHLPPS